MVFKLGQPWYRPENDSLTNSPHTQIRNALAIYRAVCFISHYVKILINFREREGENSPQAQ